MAAEILRAQFSVPTEEASSVGIGFNLGLHKEQKYVCARIF